MILARSIARDGRSTARIGGQLATASALAELGAGLVEHHGQGQTQRLLAPAVQTGFLDRYAGDAHVVALGTYREAYERLRSVATELGALREAARDRERELDLLAYQVHEIEAVGPRDGETEELAAEEGRLAHVERLMEQASAAEHALTGEDGDRRRRRVPRIRCWRARRTSTPRRARWRIGLGGSPPRSRSSPETSARTGKPSCPTPSGWRRFGIASRRSSSCSASTAPPTRTSSRSWPSPRSSCGPSPAPTIGSRSWSGSWRPPPRRPGIGRPS